MSNFDANEMIDRIIQWIREFFEENGKDCNAVIGISGGKDSSIASALCVKALGADRVFGVLMPRGVQSDIDMSYKLIEFLGIRSCEINIGSAYDYLLESIVSQMGVSESTKINLPARLRMSTLYAVAQSMHGRVCNTCNLSEDWVGYSTRYGDSVGDFSPLSDLTVTEVKEIGRALGLPAELVDKVPTDGLCGKTDEDNLGFTYEVLDKYIRIGEIEDESVKEKIDAMHKKNLFKLQLMPSFKSGLHKIHNMTDMDHLKQTFDSIGVGCSIDGNKLVIDSFDIDGCTHDVTICFDESGEYHEFKVYNCK